MSFFLISSPPSVLHFLPKPRLNILSKCLPSFSAFTASPAPSPCIGLLLISISTAGLPFPPFVNTLLSQVGAGPSGGGGGGSQFSSSFAPGFFSYSLLKYFSRLFFSQSLPSCTASTVCP